MTGWTCKLKFNWARVVAFFYFVMYGYFGAMSPKLPGISGIALSGLLAFLLAAILVGYWVVSEKYADSYDGCIVIDPRNAGIFFLLLALLAIPVFDKLNHSLYADELSYAGSAHGHGIFLGLALARMFPALGNVEFGHIVQAISLLLFVLLVALWRYISNATGRRGLVLLVALLLLFRLAFIFKGGNGSPHPTGELLPVLATGALFGLTELGLKLSYFLPFAAYLFAMYKMACRRCGQTQAFLFALTAGTLPLLWDMATVIEHALWGHIVFSLVMVDIVTSEKIDYRRLAIIISIGAIFRQSVFLALLPVILLYLFEEGRKKPAKEMIVDLLVTLSPTLLFLPFLLRSLIMGTPATGALDQSLRVAQALQALTSGYAIDAFLRVFQPFWAAIMFFAFIPLSGKTLAKNGVFFVFFALLLLIYYSIDSGLWGAAKYQSEYIAPFILVGGLNLLVWTNGNFKYKAVAVIPLVALVVINIGQLMRESEQGDKGWNRVSFSYDYRKAYSLLREKELSGRTFSVGVTYGVLPEIINGYSATDMVSAYDIYRRHRDLMAAPPNENQAIEDLTRDNTVKAVLIQDPSSKQWIETGLIRAGWRQTAKLADVRSGSLIHVLERGEGK